MAKRTRTPKRKLLSHFMLFSFFLLTLATLFLSKAFKTPIKSSNEFIEQAKVFNNKELESVTILSLKNKSGSYLFERSNTQSSAPWHMTSPRKFSASSIFVEKLFSSLKVIKTKKLFLNDPVNNSNFSLDKPTAIVVLTSPQGDTITLYIGLMNTIDNSTYLKISGRQGIYHVEAPSISLENVTLGDLIETKIFDLNTKSITSFKLSQKSINDKSQIEIELKNGTWTSKEGKFLNPARLEDLFNDFSNINSSYTLDKQSESQKKQTQNLLSNAEYVMSIQKSNGQSLTYQISKPINSLVDIPLNEESYFVVKEEASDIAYVVKTEFLNMFDLKNESLKTLELPSAP